MNKKSVSVLFVLFFLMIFGGSRAAAQEFSADMVSRAGKETTTAKIYVSQNKVRMDMANNSMIIRNDKKISWMIMPSEKMYMEHPIDMSKSPKVSNKFDGEVERVPMGTETVNGQPAEKFKVTYTEGGKSVSVYQWLKDGKIPVKVAAIDGSWSTEYKNISTALQPDSLFEPPAGYTKMEMPNVGDMMKNMLGR